MRDAIAAAKLFVVRDALDPDLEITKFVSEWESRWGFAPAFLFSHVKGYPDLPVVMNVLGREALLRGLGLQGTTWLSVLEERLHQSRTVIQRDKSLADRPLAGLTALPVLRHQPRDVGKYLTSFVGVLWNSRTQVHNLGFYRVLVKDGRRGVIFMDPRTDAHAIVRFERQQSRDAKITLYSGGPVATYLSAAWGAAPDHDSYQLAAAASSKPICLDEGEYPAAPVDAEIVIHARVVDEYADEAPFGEFKGYYCGKTRSPVIEVDEVRVRPDAYYCALFCGKEDGLTLMSMQNEARLFSGLRAAGFNVSSVRYPLSAFGEFLALIETEHPSPDLVAAAMSMDKRTKTFVAARDVRNPLAEAAIFDCQLQTEAYVKRGENHGLRLGVSIGDSPKVDRVEL